MAKKAFGYIDSILTPVPSKNLTKYKKMAKLCAKVWVEHGALTYAECQADDVEDGKVTSFPKSVKLKKGEVVFIAIVTYNSRTHRNQVMKKVMTDPRLAEMMNDEMPFDGMRMMWGGFKPVAMG